MIKERNKELLIRFHSDQTLYHGTIDIYAQIIQEFGIDIIRRKDSGVDFGPGFYVTVGKKQQSKEWAMHKALHPSYSNALEKIGITPAKFITIAEKVKPVIIAFKIKDPQAWLKLRYKEFNLDDLDWKNFVWSGRKLTDPPEYDWIFGPVADGGIYEPSPDGIRTIKNCNQLSIHNKETANMLELLEVIPC